MSPLLIIILVLLLLGGGGGYFGYNQFGGAGLGGALVLMLIIFAVLWFTGALRGGTR
jgi:preprotein translocase subunit SecG